MPAADDWAGRKAPPAVLVVHNCYRQPGGEDAVVRAEIDLLRNRGARVDAFLPASGDVAAVRALRRRPDRLIFNRRAYAEARARIRRLGARVVHCHNLFPLVSTSVYAAALAEGVPVVQTVHNFRQGCLNGLHLRDGVICERCRPGHHAAGIAFGCYGGSRTLSLGLGIAQTVNNWRGAWRQPALFVVPTSSLRPRLLDWDIPPDRIVVKPHFVPYDPGVADAAAGRYALFLGRLAPEKGLDLLLDAWGSGRPTLVIAGAGPLRAHLERRVRDEGRCNVRLVGHQDGAGVRALLMGARCLVMPSIWFETFGLVLIEAYAHGVPVVASRLGAMAEIVRDGVTGLLFDPGDRADLAMKLDLLEAEPRRVATLGAAARREYEARYSAAVQARQLGDLYDRALARPDVR